MLGTIQILQIYNFIYNMKLEIVHSINEATVIRILKMGVYTKCEFSDLGEKFILSGSSAWVQLW